MNRLVAQTRRISEVTRRNVFDRVALERVSWSGRLNEDDFLARLYDLSNLSSTDHRFSDAAGDIWQHRVRNFDWQEDWVFTDSRFNLLYCPDEELLRFLCEMVHPVVQPNQDAVATLVALFNECLSGDGFQIVEAAQISGRPVYAAREMVAGAPPLTAVRQIAKGLSTEYLSQQITRMEAAVHGDPALAIGTAKELVETCCKTILRERRATVDDAWDLPKLVHHTHEQLQLSPKGVAKSGRGTDSVRRTLGNLAQLAQGVAELRNLYGTGHGKDAAASSPPAHHARLAVGAASTLAVFLFEAHFDGVASKERR
jgi:hypothetical protein